jgi:ATP-dependent DNA helicase RecG
MDTSPPAPQHDASRRATPKDLDRPLQFEKGVGPARAEKLAKLGLRTARDMLLHVPRRYEDRTRLTNVSGLVPGEEATIRGRVIKIRTGRPRRGPAILTATLEDATAPVDVMWFNQRYLADVLREGTELVVTGKPKLYRNRLQLTPSEYEIIHAPRGGPLLDALDDGETDGLPYDDDARAAPGSPADLAAGRIVPYYPLTEGISQRIMRSLAWSAVTTAADAFPDVLPASVRESRGLLPMADALREVHFPSSDEARAEARRRLVYEELFVLQTGLALVRARAKTEIARVFEISDDVDARIRARLPFELTAAQDRAVAEIARDLASGEPMNRLLQGDVGSGKTAVAVYALLGVIASGAQAAVMAPTELLAAQHERTLAKYLAGSKVRVAVLKGGLDPVEKREALDDISSGRAHIAVGTHALLEEGVRFRSLGLAVVDEQHKFGVEQRGVMKTKGENPHILVMTATPIPRTLALAYFGDLDLSIIDELPPGRGGCDTTVVRQSKRLDAYRKVKAAVKSGRQAYVVCPRVKGKGMLDFDMEFGPVELRSAVETRERLARGPLKGVRLGLLHGRMTPEEKADEMRRFLEGDTQVLVATVVIEVGIDVSNATVLVVEHADRFGLAQLHQLRGRIVRGGHRGECFLVADPKTEGAMERLAALEETTDGFKISEADFRIRGPGEFFGTRQSGLPELRFADIISDTETLKEAREDAFRVVGDRDAMAPDEWAALRRCVAKVFAGRFDLGGVG